jgi:hypothetical protein
VIVRRSCDGIGRVNWLMPIPTIKWKTLAIRVLDLCDHNQLKFGPHVALPHSKIALPFDRPYYVLPNNGRFG